MKLRLLLLLALFITSCTTSPIEKGEEGRSLTYIMDMVHRNPGEPLQTSKYYNERFVKSAGFNSMVSQIYVQCALTYDGFDKGVIPEGSKEREWIMLQRKEVADKIKRAKGAGLDIYTFTDMLVLPTMLIEKYKDELVAPADQNTRMGIRGKLAPNIEFALTETLIRAQIKEIFETFPDLDGLVIRCGETYLYDTPYHSGSNPVRLKGKESIAGETKLINILREEVCVKYNKKLFFRTWGLSSSVEPEIFTAITNGVKPHKNLIFSIKYSCGDFHRTLPFNPTIGIGQHPYIVEFQAQPEYYGKGAHPTYMWGGVQRGFSEYKYLMQPDEVQSLEQLKDDPKFVGLWSWSRGGGWKGPFITNELWCDVNAMAMAVWASDVNQSEDEVLDKVLTKLTVKKSSFKDFKKLLKLTEDGILKGQYTALQGLRLNIWWARDQFFAIADAQPLYFEAVKQNRVDEVLNERAEAVAIWKEIVRLANRIEIEDPFYEDFLRVSAQYGLYKYEMTEQIAIIGINEQIDGATREFNVEQTRAAIKRYDELWIEWQELEDNNPICASIYKPNGFALDPRNTEGNPLRGVAATVQKMREIIEEM
ncbi:MAG: hypothetical protein SNH35_00235 [Rikenellaceae bacterium]